MDTQDDRNVNMAMEEFSINLHKMIAAKEEGNFVFSGLSAHVVLSMVAYGAGGNTAAQLRRTLRLPDDDIRSLLQFQDFIDKINSVQNVVLKVSNKIFLDEKIPVGNVFMESCSQYFRSENEMLDFSQNVDTSNRINQWCTISTNGKINQIISPTDITEITLMMLLNAVYFKGDWLEKFLPINTTMKPFYLNNESAPIDVSTMYIKKRLPFLDMPELDAECVSLPYKNMAFYMVIVVPKKVDGLKRIEKNLEKVDLKWLNGYRRDVRLWLPKFKIEATHDLKSILESVGLNEIFTPNADFRNISDVPLKVEKIMQKAFIEVNEEGTEAAAVTAVLKGGGAPPAPKILKIDRPFMYKIMYNNYTIFSGRVSNPLLH